MDEKRWQGREKLSLRTIARFQVDLSLMLFRCKRDRLLIQEWKLSSISNLKHVLKDKLPSSFFPFRVDDSFFKQKQVSLFAFSSRLLLPEQHSLLKTQRMQATSVLCRSGGGREGGLTAPFCSISPPPPSRTPHCSRLHFNPMSLPWGTHETAESLLQSFPELFTLNISTYILPTFYICSLK